VHLQLACRCLGDALRRKKGAQMGNSRFDRLGNVVTAHMSSLSNKPIHFSRRRRCEGCLRCHCLFFHIKGRYQLRCYKDVIKLYSLQAICGMHSAHSHSRVGRDQIKSSRVRPMSSSCSGLRRDNAARFTRALFQAKDEFFMFTILSTTWRMVTAP
jgi:hypothetical protein